jgi:hypothetical protein
MDYQAVVPYFPQTAGHGDGFVGNRPHLPGPFGHVHGKPAREVQGSDAFRFQPAGQSARRHVDFFKGPQKLQVGYFPGGAADIFPVQLADQTYQAFRSGKNLQDVRALVGYFRALQFDDGGIIGTGFSAGRRRFFPNSRLAVGRRPFPGNGLLWGARSVA